MVKEVLKMEEKTKKSKKSKVLASVAAVVLALSMLLGAGTYAYLTDETDDVTNTFSTNQVTVDLEETTGDDYEIVPGTSQAKDPTVTVTNTVDAYVFVEVTDTTDGLVEYAIADGWTLLDGYDNVYYRVVSADDETKSFSVLAGDTVYYSAALENSDMLDEEGNLKDGLELTFKAYAIQMEPFASAVEAWEGKDTQFAEDEESLKTALEAGGKVVLSNDVAVLNLDYSGASLYGLMTITKDTTLDLSDKTISFDKDGKAVNYYPCFFIISSGTTIIDGDGVIDGEAGNDSVYCINVNGGNLVINGGTYYGGITAVQVQKGSLTINGGFFDITDTYKDRIESGKTSVSDLKYLINCIDDAYKDGSATITITGGTFVNFDPSDNPEGEGTSYVADGYTVQEEVQANGDIWYTVVPE